MFEYKQQWNGKWKVIESEFPNRVAKVNLSRPEAKELANELNTCKCDHHLFVHYGPGCTGCAECSAGSNYAHRENRLGHPYKDHCGCLEFKPKTIWDFGK